MSQTENPVAREVAVKKADAVLRLVYGEVYAPGVPDSQGDVMTAEEIRKMAHGFVSAGLVNAIDEEHNQTESGTVVVESFIARKGDPDFIEGAWVLGVRCPQDVWERVEKGELNGFSFDGFGERHPTIVTMDIPDRLSGQTTKNHEHEHTFVVKYDKDGVFLGGQTDEVDGHWHIIKRGTVTETSGAAPHAHRFSFVEAISANH
ncbi:XkdF-like putative serine protease domain-containing protein [Roseococcus pinisoli]|uniref:Phage-like element PBSX protein XkdF domain-containing protein n=1 Tax=Roseococcus pinisoli TaxID=2835040 RepID=A0ABS5QII9_9PROT|nr:XkdF-like putative serine protease domain-containing protein [Roseococcus pinisoli]MBS7812358.1 hypothetical protein [Roseococcus pinisoli]